MCFRKKDNRLINVRSYKYKTGNYFFIINKDDNNDRLLIFDLISVEGIVNFKIINLVSNEEEEQKALSTGIYEFNLIKSVKYKILITFRSAVGSYKLSIKKLNN